MSFEEQARALDQADIDKRFSVEQVRYTLAVRKAQFEIEEMASTFRNHLLLHVDTFVLTEHLYDRDVTLRVDRKIRPRWIPTWLWDRIPTEAVSRDYHFTVDRLYPNANPNLGTPTTIKERLHTGQERTERSTWK